MTSARAAQYCSITKTPSGAVNAAQTPYPWAFSSSAPVEPLQYLNRNRFYRPDLGRFLSADPLSTPLNVRGRALVRVMVISPYRYTLNNPLKYTDPSGENIAGTVYCGPGPNDLPPPECPPGDPNCDHTKPTNWPPVNPNFPDVDTCCAIHDLCYSRGKTSALRNLLRYFGAGGGSGSGSGSGKRCKGKDCDDKLCDCLKNSPDAWVATDIGNSPLFNCDTASWAD
mgnify:CR=1 FL=1